MGEAQTPFPDDLGLDFGDFGFQRLVLNNENLVNGEVKIVADHEAGFKNSQAD